MVADEHRQIMKETLNEPQQSRNAVTELEEAKANILEGTGEHYQGSSE